MKEQVVIIQDNERHSIISVLVGQASPSASTLKKRFLAEIGAEKLHKWPMKAVDMLDNVEITHRNEARAEAWMARQGLLSFTQEYPPLDEALHHYLVNQCGFRKAEIWTSL